MSLKFLFKVGNYYNIKYGFEKVAVPIPSDYIDNIFSKPIREIVSPKTNFLVYHGTCTSKLKDIISHGSLDPGKSAEGKTWENSSPGIYVTTKLTGFSSSAELYAHKAAKIHGGDPIALELSIPFGSIEMDPDDSKVLEESQELNEAGKVQGRVMQAIPVGKITRVYEFGSMGRYKDYSFSGYIEKLLKESKDRKYNKVLKETLPGAVKTEPVIDIEAELAEILMYWHDSLFNPYQVGTNQLTGHDNALLIAFRYKDDNAIKALKEFCQVMGHDYSEVDNYPDEYKPKSYETLKMFLKRHKRTA